MHTSLFIPTHKLSTQAREDREMLFQFDPYRQIAYWICCLIRAAHTKG